MKNKHLSLIASLFGVFALAACGEKTVTDVTQGSTSKESLSEFKSIPFSISHDKQYFALSEYNVNLFLGSGKTSTKISIHSIPGDIALNDVTFSSLDENVVTVDSEGVITAVGKGFTKVKVSARNGSVVEYANVSVNDAVANDVAGAKFTALDAATKATTFKGIDKFYTHEYTIQSLSADGVVYNESEYVQDMMFSKKDLYFEIYSDDLYLKTPDGDREYNNGRWIFYIDVDSFSMFLCHETAYAKTYMEVNCNAYLDKIGAGEIEEYQIIYDLLDMFFVAGSKIVSNTFSEIDGSGAEGVFADYADMFTKGYTNVQLAAGSPNGEDMYANYVMTQEDSKIGNTEEADLCIPAGTLCDYVVNDEIFVKDKVVVGENYKVDMTYKIDIGNGEQDGARKFYKLTQNYTEFEIKKPDLSQYSLVTSIADL